MEFKDLKIGNNVYILENAGTFRKVSTYNIGTVTQISAPYDDNAVPNPYLVSAVKRKVVDITISCEGVQKKLTVGADKTSITDSSIGLTVSTSKDDLVIQLKTQCKEYEDKIAAIEFYKEEAAKCRRILEQLKDTPPTQEKGESTTTTDIIKVS